MHCFSDQSRGSAAGVGGKDGKSHPCSLFLSATVAVTVFAVDVVLVTGCLFGKVTVTMCISLDACRVATAV